MLVCLQGTQTNVMIANLILLSFLCFENKQQWLAAFALAAGIYIRPLGNTVYIMPPYCITTEELKKVYAVLESVNFDLK